MCVMKVDIHIVLYGDFLDIVFDMLCNKFVCRNIAVLLTFDMFLSVFVFCFDSK